MLTIHDIDLSLVEITNDTYPELNLDYGYFILEDDGSVSFSITSFNEIDLRSTGRHVKFALNIFMNHAFRTEDFIFENGKAYLKSFKPSDNYEFVCLDLDTMDHELSEIYEYVDSFLATANSSSTYTLIADLKQD